MKAKKSAIPTLTRLPFAAGEAVDAYALGKADCKYLDDREKTIEAGRVTFLEVGRALIEIRDYKDGLLYRRYGGWDQYCKERWEFGRSYAYRLIGAAEVVAQLSPRGDNGEFGVPSSEKQIRVLRLLERPEDMRKAWREASKVAGTRKVTAALVSQSVRKMIAGGAKRRTAERTEKSTTPRRVTIEIRHIKEIRVQLAKIREAATGTKAAGKITDAVEQIEALLPEQ